MTAAPSATLLTVFPQMLHAATSEQLPDEPPGQLGEGAANTDGESSRAELRALAASTIAIEQLLAQLAPSLRSTAHPNSQLGAAMCLHATVKRLDVRVLPYAVLLIAPLVSGLSSGLARIRSESSAAFGILMPLLPLEAGTADPADMSAEMRAAKAAERPFIDQLLGVSGAKPPRYEMPVKVDAELRSYQQAGVDWLAFLRRFGLHGILCDDMGLGKTLQTLCVLAAAAHERRQLAAVHAADGRPPPAPLPCLVVCPPTLVGHWKAEARTFCSGRLSVVEYVGTAAQRGKLLPTLVRYELVVTSFETLRADVASLAPVRWDYVVLDEGHIIRNAKAKVTVAAKRLQASRRLILSGTPLQNHALELWSLFDFLMPGYLGNQAFFDATYARPIHAAQGARAGDMAFLEGEAALARLHRQVLPFCLRRTKESVLTELPAKLLQDRICELHPVQLLLYRAFSESRDCALATQAVSHADDQDGSGVVSGASAAASGMVNEGLTASVAGQKRRADTAGGGGSRGVDSAAPGATHVFTALQYLRKICNHPLLTLNATHPLFERCTTLAKPYGGLHALACSPKLQALQQILHECGIGRGTQSEAAESSGGSGRTLEAASREQRAMSGSSGADGPSGADPGEEGGAVATHRALIFSQSGAMLDLVEADLLRAHMPSVTYLRLDGKVPAQQRFGIATRFSSDPSVDLMLLTTSVGGLGLNLTAADVVIFLDHDWNPMKDLQAMDRAHRLGQKRVVSVYRLLMRDTLEEKIMSLQAFKMHIASSVVNQQNSSLATMNTQELLDLFQLSPATKQPTPADPADASMDDAAVAAAATSQGGSRGRGGLANILEGVGEMWSAQEYEEYELDGFLATLDGAGK